MSCKHSVLHFLEVLLATESIFRCFSVFARHFRVIFIKNLKFGPYCTTMLAKGSITKSQKVLEKLNARITFAQTLQICCTHEYFIFRKFEHKLQFAFGSTNTKYMKKTWFLETLLSLKIAKNFRKIDSPTQIFDNFRWNFFCQRVNILSCWETRFRDVYRTLSYVRFISQWYFN